MNIYSKSLLKQQMDTTFSEGRKINVPSRSIVQVTTPAIRGIYKSGDQDRMFNAIAGAQSIGITPIGMTISGKYSSGFDIPLNGRASINERIIKGQFSASAHTLPENWQDLFDALKMDLTIKKETNPTVRQLIYNMADTPNATRIMKLTALMPYAFQFKTNTGNGDAVPLGEVRGKMEDIVEFYIKATGFTYTLLASLFDMALDMGRVNDGVNVSYNLQRDADAIDPILAYNYGAANTTKHTAANTTGANPQEKWYLTFMKAVDDLGKRKESIFGNTIKANDLVLLCSSNTSRHFRHIQRGFAISVDKNYPALDGISTVVEYDGDSIVFNDGKVLAFGGVGDTYAYLIKRNELMNIYTKRGLTVEVDNTPDVLTLAQAEKAWYYSEAIYNEGIKDYIQKITLPAWYA